MLLYTYVVTGGANLSTGNADLAMTSWSFFCFTPVRATESFPCCAPDFLKVGLQAESPFAYERRLQ